MWHDLNNLRALLLFCCNFERIGEDEGKDLFEAKAKDTLLKQQRFCFPMNFHYDLQVSAVGSGVCIPNVGTEERTRRKTKNDPGKQIILPSSNKLELGCPNCDANQRGTIKSKARKQHLLQKQTSKRGGRKT